MKKLLFLNIFVVVSTIQLLAQNITIGTGTAASYFYGHTTEAAQLQPLIIPTMLIYTHQMN